MLIVIGTRIVPPFSFPDASIALTSAKSSSTMVIVPPPPSAVSTGAALMENVRFGAGIVSPSKKSVMLLCVSPG